MSAPSRTLAIVSSRPDDFAAANTAPQRDELAARRERKFVAQLSPAQVRRLLAAAALREKATHGENDE